MATKKKNLKSVTADLAPLAERLPSQHVAGPRPERPAQFSMTMRRALHHELARLALDAGVTMRAFVLQALRDKGLSVTDDDLVDMRKGRPRAERFIWREGDVTILPPAD